MLFSTLSTFALALSAVIVAAAESPSGLGQANPGLGGTRPVRRSSHQKVARFLHREKPRKLRKRQLNTGTCGQTTLGSDDGGTGSASNSTSGHSQGGMVFVTDPTCGSNNPSGQWERSRWVSSNCACLIRSGDGLFLLMVMQRTPLHRLVLTAVRAGSTAASTLQAAGLLRC